MNVQLEVILGRRWNSDVGKEEVLIKWRDQSEIEATWVEMCSFKAQFPVFHLDDKVSFAKGGIVRPKPPIVHTYQRKGKRGNIREALQN